MKVAVEVSLQGKLLRQVQVYCSATRSSASHDLELGYLAVAVF